MEGENKEETEVCNSDTLRYTEKKLWDKGVIRMDRHPGDGMSLNCQPKSGHGGKYTWEGPRDVAETDVPAAKDERDPNNYVDEEVEERIVKGSKDDDKDLEAGLVVGEIEVAKTADLQAKGVARIEVRPPLHHQLP